LTGLSLKIGEWRINGHVVESQKLASRQSRVDKASGLLLYVIPDFKDKTTYAPYASFIRQISHIVTNKG